MVKFYFFQENTVHSAFKNYFLLSVSTDTMKQRLREEFDAMCHDDNGFFWKNTNFIEFPSEEAYFSFLLRYS